MKTKEHRLTNLTKLYVLLLLHEKPKYGYELMMDFKTRIDKTLSPGQIYPLLKDMAAEGLVTVTAEYQGDRKRNVFSLTEVGSKLCQQLMERLKDLIEIVSRKSDKS